MGSWWCIGSCVPAAAAALAVSGHSTDRYGTSRAWADVSRLAITSGLNGAIHLRVQWQFTELGHWTMARRLPGSNATRIVLQGWSGGTNTVLARPRTRRAKEALFAMAGPARQHDGRNTHGSRLPVNCCPPARLLRRPTAEAAVGKQRSGARGESASPVYPLRRRPVPYARGGGMRTR
jgi:hypothetical protein